MNWDIILWMRIRYWAGAVLDLLAGLTMPRRLPLI